MPQHPELADGQHGHATAALAHPGRRLLATLIDMVLVPALTIGLVLVTGATEDAEDYANLPALGLSILGLAILSYLLLNGVTLFKQGQTLGKKVLGIAIAPAQQQPDGQWPTHPPHLWKLICLRALFFPMLFLLPLWPLSLLPVIDQLFIFGKHRRCLHDYLAGTVVIDR